MRAILPRELAICKTDRRVARATAEKRNSIAVVVGERPSSPPAVL
jgi:hypothetical protein